MEWEYEGWRDKIVIPYCELDRHDGEERFIRRPHLHHNIELLYVVEGGLALDLLSVDGDETRMVLRENDVIAINCNIIHATSPRNSVAYYVVFIPPKCLMMPLHIDIGKTYMKPYHDENGLLRPMLGNMAMFSRGNGGPAEGDVLLTSLANSVMAILLPRMSEGLAELRGSTVRTDMLTYVYKNYRNPDLTAESISRAFGYSKRTLSDIFGESVGKGVKRYIDSLRVNDAKTLLLTTQSSVESISYEVGFDCPRTFFRVFKAHTGKTPSDFRNEKEETHCAEIYSDAPKK